MRSIQCNMDSHVCCCICVDETSTMQQITLGQAVLSAYADNQPAPMPASGSTPSPSPAAASRQGATAGAR